MNNTKNGSFYLIPVPLGEDDPRKSLSPLVIETIESLDFFIAENRKSAFRFLVKILSREHLDRIDMEILDEHTKSSDIPSLLTQVMNGKNVGIMSEAGMPCIADPGSLVVKAAHEKSIRVIPLPGPSSIVLALSASGMSGQYFSFKGYLPQEGAERRKALQALEREMIRTGESQIFIETPYRNDRMLADMVSVLKEDTKVCVAVNIMQVDESVISKPVKELRASLPVIGKRPAIFIIGR